MNGTSVAAPVLARRLYNAMVEQPVGRDGWGAVLRRLAKQDSAVRLPPA